MREIRTSGLMSGEWKRTTPTGLVPRHSSTLLELVALANPMRLSLMKAAHVVVSSAAWQEIRVRSGRDDKFVAGR